LKDTLDLPFSVLKVVRWETFVRGGSLALRNENIIGMDLKADGSKVVFRVAREKS